MQEPGLLRIGIAYGAIVVLILSMVWFPRAWWTRMLRTRHGPGTDYQNMTRSEVLRSAGGFLGIAGFGLLTVVVAVWVGNWLYGDVDRSQPLSALMFMSTLVMMMGVAGAGYLGIRAVFRPPTMYRWYEDPLSQTEFLKQYVVPGVDSRLVIVQHPDRQYELVKVVPSRPDAVVGQTPRVFAWGTVESLVKSSTLEEVEARALSELADLPAAHTEGA